PSAGSCDISVSRETFFISLPENISYNLSEVFIMTLVSAVTMQKGGVGKTTTAINLAAGLALGDYETLLIDLDPQANATGGLGCDNYRGPGIYELLFGTADFADACKPTSIDGLSLLPADIELNGARAEMPRQNSNFRELSNQLAEIKNQFERIIIDCPPSLGPLTLNALLFADSVIIPLQSEYYALQGLSQLWETVQRIKDNLNEKLYVSGILLTMHDERTNLANDVKSEVEKYFEELVLKTTIPRNVRISEAPGFGKPVITHAPCCRGSIAYLRACEEVICREQHRTG
ncbi:MAG: ParA family protein, partial [bacterium]